MTKRCARNDCHRPMATTIPQHEFLGLCTFHHTQFRNGTIGHDHNPEARETPTEEAAALIHMINDDYFNSQGTYRQLADALGLTKDTIFIILKHRYRNVRSKVWMQLQAGAANLINQHEGEDAA